MQELSGTSHVAPAGHSAHHLFLRVSVCGFCSPNRLQDRKESVKKWRHSQHICSDLQHLALDPGSTIYFEHETS
jgi:hypothetical protein